MSSMGSDNIGYGQILDCIHSSSDIVVVKHSHSQLVPIQSIIQILDILQNSEVALSCIILV